MPYFYCMSVFLFQAYNATPEQLMLEIILLYEKAQKHTVFLTLELNLAPERPDSYQCRGWDGVLEKHFYFQISSVLKNPALFKLFLGNNLWPQLFLNIRMRLFQCVITNKNPKNATMIYHFSLTSQFDVGNMDLCDSAPKDDSGKQDAIKAVTHGS